MVIGRFAPSPTGPLHFGSLIAALASYCDAKSQQGLWLVRMEDLDQPRTQAGAAEHILQQLKAFGFAWDGDVVYQSQRSALYTQALERLTTLTSNATQLKGVQESIIYPCTCTRKEIADSSTAQGIEGAIYPNTCRVNGIKPNLQAAFRIKTDGINITFNDAIQGLVKQDLQQDIGDFVLKRSDGLFAYQLAVVVDDAAQGITHIVRGADLLQSTPRQIYLQQLLNLPKPKYAHIPLARNAQGEKLSKQTLAKPLNAATACLQLMGALQFLGQNLPDKPAQSNPADILDWAVSNWNLSAIPAYVAHNLSFD